MATQYSIDQTAIEEILSEERLIQLTDDADAGVVDASIITKAIDAVEGELHQYAGVFYETPLRESDGVTVPAGVREKLLYAIAYRLMTRRPEWLNAPTEEAQHWPRVHKEWRQWLEGLASRKVLVPGATELSTPASSTTGGASQSSRTAKFDDLGSLF